MLTNRWQQSDAITSFRVNVSLLVNTTHVRGGSSGGLFTLEKNINKINMFTNCDIAIIEN